MRDKLAGLRLRLGDALLMLGPKEEIARLRRDDNFIVLEERRDVPLQSGRTPITHDRVRQWLEQAGFEAVELFPLTASSTCALARRPAR